MEQFKSIAESYQKSLGESRQLIVELQKSLETSIAETAAARKEAAESRQLIVELQKEVATLTALVTTLTLGGSSTAPSIPVSSPGRSWASIASPSSLASSNTRAARAGLGLPAVVLDLRSATDETKALVDDPTQTREKIRATLKDDAATANVEIEGVKPTSRTTVKIFVDSEESIENLRRATHWLDALPGARLQGEQWFPIKLNDVKKESVFDASGAEREDFAKTFKEENGGAQIKKIIWLSGTKRYGSMAIYLSRLADAESLLTRRIVHVRGEASFSDLFYERQRPLRCHKCQQYNHKEDRCPNPVACSKCAGNHRGDQCTSEITKCAACRGDHAVTDRKCPAWEKEWDAIRRKEQETATRRSGTRSNGSQ
jgi:hypothetical protein